MVDAEKSPDMAASTGEAGGEAAGPPPTGGGSPGMRGLGSDFKPLLSAVLSAVMRILGDAAGSLETLYPPGKPALLQGLVLGGVTAVLIPLLHLLFNKMSVQDYSPEAGEVLKQLLGGLVFLAAGVVLSFLLRRSLGRSASKDWRDDVYLFGSAMVFLLAGTVLGGILALIRGSFFANLAGTVMTVGLLLMAFTYHCGLLKVAKAEAGRGVWVAVVAIGGASLAGALLDFTLAVGDSQLLLEMTRALQHGMQGMEHGLRGMERLFPGLGR